MKPKVLLLWPPVYDFALFDLFLNPFGLLRLGGWFADAGYEVELLNCLDYTEPESLKHYGAVFRQSNGTGKFFRSIVERPAVFGPVQRHFARYGILPAVIERRIKQSRPDLVLVGSGMTYWYPGVIEAVSAVRRILPGVPVILGGVYATLCHAHAEFNSGADQVVAGDGFSGLAPILRKYGLPAPNLSTSGGARTPAHPLSRPLLVREGYVGAAAVRLHSGCPMHCSYCASSAVSGEFVAGDPDAFFEEVRDVHTGFGITNFAFYDDALLFDAGRGIIPFLHAVIDSGLQLNFYTPNGLHIAYMTDELGHLMKRAGFRELRFGIESMRQDFHSRHDGKYAYGSLPAAIAMLRAADFKSHEITAYLLAGLPGQTAQEAEEVIEAVHAAGVRAYVSEYSPIPGTALWDESVKRSRFPIAEEPLCQNNTLFAMQWEGFTVEDLERLKKKARELNRKI